MGTVDNLIAQFQTERQTANLANEKRYQEGLGLYDQIIDIYKEGGSFGAGTEAAIERAGTKAVSQGAQGLVSAGLSNTTQIGGLRKKFEEEVGTPTRLQSQDVRFERLSGAIKGKAGFIERREDVGPSFGDIAGLIQGASRGAPSAPTFRPDPYGGRTTFGASSFKSAADGISGGGVTRKTGGGTIYGTRKRPTSTGGSFQQAGDAYYGKAYQGRKSTGSTSTRSKPAFAGSTRVFPSRRR